MCGMCVGPQACVMQINPEHPIIKTLKAKVDLADEGQVGDDAKRTAQLLFNVAALRGG